MTTTIGHYTLEGVLGKGGFASVRAGTDTRTGERVAIKCLERSETLNPDERIKQEIRAFRRLQHTNIVRYKDHFVTPRHVYICMEIVTGGEIYDQLEQKGKFPEEQARKYFRQLVEAVEYCHSAGLCHRDLKLENILLAADSATLKITDFGFSKSFKAQPKTVVGTALYVAPEVVLQEGSCYDGKAADTWSLGIILYLFAVGRFPFNRGHVGGVGPGMNTRQKDRFRTDNFKAPDHMSAGLTALLRRVLCADPALRSTLPEIKRSSWYTDGGRWPASLPTEPRASNSTALGEGLAGTAAAAAAADTSGSSGTPVSPNGSMLAWDVLDVPAEQHEEAAQQELFSGFDDSDDDSDEDDLDWGRADVRRAPANEDVSTMAEELGRMRW